MVTWPGRFMRARHTYGFYQLMGIAEAIAGNFDDYVALALELGRDIERRNRVRRLILERNGALYDSDPTVRAFEAFLWSVLASKRP